MKKNLNTKLYQLFAIGLLLFTSACSDSFFNEQAGERMNPEDHYKSRVDALVSMEGAITPLRDALPKLIMIDGLRSDMMDVTSNADVYLKAINNQVFTPDNPYLDASDYYKVIINLNEILANIDKVALSDRYFDAYTAHYYKGAIIGQRSWVYLNLLRMYGKANFIKDNLTSIPKDLTANLMDKSVLIDTLINQTLPYIFDPTTDNHAELRFPAALYPVSTGTTKGGEIFYANSKAVLGELYLEKGDYTNAVKYLKMALESYTNTDKIYKVVDTYKEIGWKNIFFTSENRDDENVAVIPFNRNEAQNNPLPDFFLYDKQYMVKPTKLLVDSFENQVQLTDVKGDIYRGIGLTIDTLPNGEYYINKYSIDETEPTSSDIIYSRAADLHLLLAEALNRSGDQKTALILLNAGFNNEKTKPAPYFKWATNLGIRGRVSLKPRLVPEGMPAEFKADYIEDLIMDERALELAFEGKRWFDLVRVAERRNDPSYLAYKVAAKFKGTAKYDDILNKLKNPANWYLPIK